MTVSCLEVNMELKNGMMLRHREMLRYSRKCIKLELRPLNTYDEEFMGLLRMRIADAATAWSEAVGKEEEKQAYVLLMAMIGIFERASVYGANLEHDIRKEMRHAGPNERFYVLVSHAE